MGKFLPVRSLRGNTYGTIYAMVTVVKAGILFRWQSVWIGAHYSPFNKRLCVNVIPFVTVWITGKGGIVPSHSRDIAKDRRIAAFEILGAKIRARGQME